MRNKGTTGVIVMIGLALFIALAIGAGFCWQYTITSWANHFHKEVHVAFWQCLLLGVVPFIGQFSLVTAVLTWLIMLFI